MPTRKTRNLVAVGLLLPLGLAACQPYYDSHAGHGPGSSSVRGHNSGSPVLGGIIVGGAAGAVIGGAPGAAIGVLIGAALGATVAQGMDMSDGSFAFDAEARALYAPVGQPVEWFNPATGNRGYITPIRDGRDAVTGALCREFEIGVQIGGFSQTGVAAACQGPSGFWELAA